MPTTTLETPPSDGARKCASCGSDLVPEQTVCGECGAVAYPRPGLNRTPPKWAFVLTKSLAGLLGLTSMAAIMYVFTGVDLPGYMDHIQLAEVGAFVLISLTVLCIYISKNLNENGRPPGDSQRSEKPKT